MNGQIVLRSVVEFTRSYLTQRHRSLGALVTLLLVVSAQAMYAGGGWVEEPGHGNIRVGYNWKLQPDALRRDIEGELYTSLFTMTHDYRFLYLSGEVGILPGLEGSLLVTYLWAAETVDSTAEDPSRFYDGPSDMWVGLKYQLWGGDFPTAIAATVRLPYLYEGSSVRNGHVLTEVPGLLGRDYELSAAVSHSFDSRIYASLGSGFRLREGAATNQILLVAETGGKLPFLDDRVSVKLGVDGAFSVGEPEPSTSKDRFSGLTLERGSHMFDFNDASYLRPQVGISVQVLPEIDVSAGYSYIVWGHSTVVYQDFLVQLGYSF